MNCFIEDMLADFAFDIAAGWAFTGRQPVDGERKQPEMIAMTAMPMRRARAAITDPLEVIRGLSKRVCRSAC